MVAAVPDEDGLISGLSEDQLVTVDEIDTLIKEVWDTSVTLEMSLLDHISD